KSGWYDRTSQAFAVFLPVKSVGVVGDARTYEWLIALRAVETIDFMTAQWAQLPHELLGVVSNRVTSGRRRVSCGVSDISGRPPATTEWVRGAPGIGAGGGSRARSAERHLSIPGLRGFAGELPQPVPGRPHVAVLAGLGEGAPVFG